MPDSPPHRLAAFLLAVLLWPSAGCASDGPPPEEGQPAPDYQSVEGQPEQPTADTGNHQPGSATQQGGNRQDDANRALLRKAARYQQKVVRAIGERWQPPSISDARFARLADRAVVYVRIDASGTVTSYEFRQNSGSKAFDDSIKSCLDAFTDDGEATLPVPEDAELLEAIVQRGFLLRKWHYQKD